MKIIVDEDAEELEIYIKCKEITPYVLALQSKIKSIANIKNEIKAKKDDKEYYIELNEVLFFESYGREIVMHTKNDSFVLKSKLYELEEMLPNTFIRIAKSTIVNTKLIYAVNKSLVLNGVIEFKNSDKQATISRGYYKVFNERMDEVRRWKKMWFMGLLF